MKNINLSNIYLHMLRYYGVNKFELFSSVNEIRSSPLETMIEFYYDTSIKVNPARLQKILEKDIKNVNRFFVVVEDSKIIIHIEYQKKSGLFDYDLEYSMN